MTDTARIRLRSGRAFNRPLSIAPMMDRTDRHFRFFARTLTRETLLYTEMITTGAVLHGDRARLLAFDPIEKPLALQLGGDDPRELSECARIAADLDFDEINLNVGCPSQRVQSGNFGACLMKEPQRVAAAVEAMRTAVDLPVTVKHRIGVDDFEGYDFLRAFVQTVALAGCDRFTVHARKALLSGLSPKENRSIPPLHPEIVYRLKEDHPELLIEINGGVQDLTEAQSHLQSVDAVMIGRAATDRPYLFAAADRQVFASDRPPIEREEAARSMMPYIESEIAAGTSLPSITRHLSALFAGVAGARAWRRCLAEGSRQPGADQSLIEVGLELVERESLKARSRGSSRAEALGTSLPNTVPVHTVQHHS